jgi:hypothetical protein
LQTGIIYLFHETHFDYTMYRGHLLCCILFKSDEKYANIFFTLLCVVWLSLNPQFLNGITSRHSIPDFIILRTKFHPPPYQISPNSVPISPKSVLNFTQLSTKFHSTAYNAINKSFMKYVQPIWSQLSYHNTLVFTSKVVSIVCVCVCSCNNCCRGKTIGIAYSGCVFVALLSSMQCACAVLYLNMWPVQLHNIFPRYTVNSTIS